MNKFQGYYDRALKTSDKRYARVFEKMGYMRRDMVAGKPADPPAVQQHDDEITALRKEYERVVCKRPFMGWGADKLREKIAEAEEAENDVPEEGEE